MYINPQTRSNQSTYAPGLIKLTPEEEQIYIQHNGFVTITEDPSTESGYVIAADLEKWEEWIATRPDPTISLKEQKIAKSKTDLESYLASHPLLWTDGKYYTITAEKQAQLTSKLAVAQAKETTGIPYNLTWNTTQEECVPWEISDLYALAFAIDERVTKLVSYQQSQEVAIRNASTVEEVNAIVIDYDSVE